MANVVRIAQFFYLVDTNNNRYAFQNYFINDKKRIGSTVYTFAPFRAEGMVSNLTGDNALLQVLFPAEDFSIALAEQADGNRLTRLTFTTQWLNASDAMVRPPYEERYVGIGASISETTLELRFRSAMDSVGAQFPARTMTLQNVGPLPINSQVSFQ
jgi:hypothetical protein